MVEEQPRQKSRHLALTDFYTNLQLEYISYRFRAYLYDRAEDKKKFLDIADKKREKIENITFRNRLVSIFNKKEMLEKYFNRFFNESGLPNFQYRDDYQRQVKGKWDSYYFFKRGVSVKILCLGEEYVLGEILSYDRDNDLIYVLADEKEYRCKPNQLQRIIPTDFFDSFEIK